jgi:hypothetical protein
MSTANAVNKEVDVLKKGGGFLLGEISPKVAFVPEDFNDEQKMFARTTEEFIEKEVVPYTDEMEHQNLELTVDLLRKAGQLGLLAVEIPEQYGGLGLDKISALIVAEKVAGNSSFSVSFGGHNGIGTSPILMFGTVEQKKKYLPKVATGELLSSYALTEPEAGSDALSGKTRADLSPDGKYYILNGSKMWITNAGFADLFTTMSSGGINVNTASAIVLQAVFGLDDAQVHQHGHRVDEAAAADRTGRTRPNRVQGNVLVTYDGLDSTVGGPAAVPDAGPFQGGPRRTTGRIEIGRAHV